MLCDSCKERDAVVHVTQIQGSAVTQLNLCEKCAADRGVDTPSAMPKHPLGEFLHAVQQQVTIPSADGVKCHFCGMTLREFRTAGRWGCARCYSTFEPSMRELLRRVHGSSRHVGRAYRPPQPESIARATELTDLREQLRRAIESEQFELAADLRDKIRILE
jgi:protein arginine kinase activator